MYWIRTTRASAPESTFLHIYPGDSYEHLNLGSTGLGDLDPHFWLATVLGVPRNEEIFDFGFFA